ncbi:MAG TPA: hypothetical protein VM580_27255 [Labilithrix sp.]|nr:hypothetical protein [Labilithrix sp.]
MTDTNILHRPITWLRSAGAQGDVINGLAHYEDWQTLWTECPRGDWLLGIAERIGVDRVALVRAAIGCARIVDGDEDAVRVIAMAEQWTEGRASDADVARETQRLEQASSRAVDPAREAADRAALAVGFGVADRRVLASAPAAAAESVMVSSMDCGFELAMRWAHDRCAAAVRAAIPWSAVQACVERLECQD